MKALPAKAPRGKAFAIVHLSHVTPAPKMVEARGQWPDAAGVQKAAAAIDWRLQPSVVIVEAMP